MSRFQAVPIEPENRATDSEAERFENEGGGRAPEAAGVSEPPPARQEQPLPSTVRETLEATDRAWAAFLAMASAFPSERMDERLSETGWTRKQMLAHISAWHDLTAERLIKLINTGEPKDLTEHEDAINARVARQAVGRTAGEVLREMEASYGRLRRQIVRLTDSQLAVGDDWAAHIIAGNTYGHYDEHASDVYVPPPPPGASGRR